LVTVVVDIAFKTKQEALNYGKSDAARHKFPPKYEAVKGRYWSMKLMEYVPTWVCLLHY
jgi:hypothetical protein